LKKIEISCQILRFGERAALIPYAIAVCDRDEEITMTSQTRPPCPTRDSAAELAVAVRAIDFEGIPEYIRLQEASRAFNPTSTKLARLRDRLNNVEMTSGRHLVGDQRRLLDQLNVLCPIVETLHDSPAGKNLFALCTDLTANHRPKDVPAAVGRALHYGRYLELGDPEWADVAKKVQQPPYRERSAKGRKEVPFDEAYHTPSKRSASNDSTPVATYDPEVAAILATHAIDLLERSIGTVPKVVKDGIGDCVPDVYSILTDRVGKWKGHTYPEALYRPDRDWCDLWRWATIRRGPCTDVMAGSSRELRLLRRSNKDLEVSLLGLTIEEIRTGELLTPHPRVAPIWNRMLHEPEALPPAIGM
jgi:hypothetical protein